MFSGRFYVFDVVILYKWEKRKEIRLNLKLTRFINKIHGNFSNHGRKFKAQQPNIHN